MERGIRTNTIIKKFVSTDEYGHREPIEDPDITDLPGWVIEACQEGKIFITPNDHYLNLWVETPYTAEGLGIYVVAGAGCIMFPRDGEVIVLCQPDWERFFTRW